MLFKSYIASRNHPTVLICIAVILTHRLVWTILDLLSSGGDWQGYCAYVQNPLNGVGYNVADIVSDVFSTINAVIFNWNFLKAGRATDIIRVILQENFFRSILIILTTH
ncbi:hypothetical protein BJ741DRAFT_590559 [Chytriomyces cf. hyalinus JEL632]|nr:hypothetical protein BJ741DRAFT_590559 [Chytriomyces cf. hyalinus JEL632]